MRADGVEQCGLHCRLCAAHRPLGTIVVITIITTIIIVIIMILTIIVVLVFN